MSREARIFLNGHRHKIQFDTKTGAVQLDGAYGLLTVEKRNPKKLKDIRVVTNRDRSAIYFYILNKEIDKNGEGGEVLIVNHRDDGEFEHDTVKIQTP